MFNSNRYNTGNSLKRAYPATYSPYTAWMTGQSGTATNIYVCKSGAGTNVYRIFLVNILTGAVNYIRTSSSANHVPEFQASNTHWASTDSRHLWQFDSTGST